MNLYDTVTQLVGSVPDGYEPLIYLCCIVMLVWLLSTFFSILQSFFRVISGDRHV